MSSYITVLMSNYGFILIRLNSVLSDSSLEGEIPPGIKDLEELTEL